MQNFLSDPHPCLPARYTSWPARLTARGLPLISWWRNESRLDDTRTVVVHTDNSSVISYVKFEPKVEDHDTFLHCRAETPGLKNSAREAVLYLVITHIPYISVLASATEVNEGDDVSYECLFKSNPAPSKVEWLHNGELVLASRPEVQLEGHFLRLWHVSPSRAGNYVCQATNEEGVGTSPPATLDVKFRPRCREGPRRVDARLGESVRVECPVIAHPSDKLTYTWKFYPNNTYAEAMAGLQRDMSWEVVPLPTVPTDSWTEAYPGNGTLDGGLPEFGSLVCWATNEVGELLAGCRVQINPEYGQVGEPRECFCSVETAHTITAFCNENSWRNAPLTLIAEAVLNNNSTNTTAYLYFEGHPAVSNSSIRLCASGPVNNSTVVDLFTMTKPEVRAGGAVKRGWSLIDHYLWLGIAGSTLLLTLVVLTIAVHCHRERLKGTCRRQAHEADAEQRETDDADAGMARNHDEQSQRLQATELSKDPDLTLVRCAADSGDGLSVRTPFMRFNDSTKQPPPGDMFRSSTLPNYKEPFIRGCLEPLTIECATRPRKKIRMKVPNVKEERKLVSGGFADAPVLNLSALSLYDQQEELLRMSLDASLRFPAPSSPYQPSDFSPTPPPSLQCPSDNMRGSPTSHANRNDAVQESIVNRHLIPTNHHLSTQEAHTMPRGLTSRNQANRSQQRPLAIENNNLSPHRSSKPASGNGSCYGDASDERAPLLQLPLVEMRLRTAFQGEERKDTPKDQFNF